MIYRKTDPHSFPSGHAARAFMIAVLATGLGPGWLAVVLWVWAPLVSVARVAMGVHYVLTYWGDWSWRTGGLAHPALTAPHPAFIASL